MSEYIPSPRQWVREQVELYEKSGGKEGTTRIPPSRFVTSPWRSRCVYARFEDAAERARLWKLAVAAFPPYEEYQAKTTRRIPIFIAEPKA